MEIGRTFRIVKAETFRTVFQFALYHNMDDYKISIWIIFFDKGIMIDFFKKEK
jgi:hypothetical protein